jgi:hypothetical protein
MAFRRSAVRSRLAPPPHRRGRAAFAAAAPLLLLLRAALALALLGLSPAAGPRPDPALAMAQAAGALCLADAPDSVPQGHSHEACLACPGSAPASGLAAGPVVPVRAIGHMPARATAGRAMPAVGWAAYASRAPPGLAG